MKMMLTEPYLSTQHAGKGLEGDLISAQAAS